jgi:hypothetical protein
MFKNKHVFWIALVVAFFVFWFGILLGISFEKGRIDEIRDFYFESETNIFDFELSSDIIRNSNLSCEMIYEQSILFADRIYKEASKLEKYDDSNKITRELVYLHRRYDLLRTMLWMDLIQAKDRCEGDVNVIVYFYDYVDTDLTTKAVQGTMSNFLVELKQKYEDKIILIPIAVDTGVESVEILREHYGLEEVPGVFINEEIRLEDIADLKNFDEKTLKGNSVLSL